MFDYNNANVMGHLVIKDKESNEILVDKSNAVHFGNFSNAIARALAGDSTGHIKFMSFGNGGTQIDATGTITYKEPNVSNLIDQTAGLYNQTYQKDVSVGDAGNNVSVAPTGSTSFSDIVVLATLAFGEPGDQDLTDGTGNIEDDYVFDEIALYDGGVGGDGLMLTHVLFHPVKKSANREIEIEYTLRIQVS